MPKQITKVSLYEYRSYFYIILGTDDHGARALPPLTKTEYDIEKAIQEADGLAEYLEVPLRVIKYAERIKS